MWLERKLDRIESNSVSKTSGSFHSDVAARPVGLMVRRLRSDGHAFEPVEAVAQDPNQTETKPKKYSL